MNFKNMRLYSFCLVVIVLFSMQFNAVADEFTPLFNGQNLDGWVNVNCAPETWSVGDGMIHCTGTPIGVLRTEKMYENFILELEWRHLQTKGNSGVFIHSDPIPVTGKPFTRSTEVQILDSRNTENYTSHGDIFGIQGATMTPSPLHPNGWMRSLPQKRLCNETGEWNSYRIECRDGSMFLSVNEEQVTTAFHLNPRKGYICLEAEGGAIDFKNVRILELPGTNPPEEVTAHAAEGFKALFTGVDLRGWKQVDGNKDHWIVEDGVIKYDGRSDATGEDRHLWTLKSYKNFELIVDWRLPDEPKIDNVPVVLPDGSTAKDKDGEELTVQVKDAGDSGIYLRGSSKNQINIWNWPVGSGEIWGYRTDKSMTTKVRRDATPLFNADNPVGKWNRFRIKVIDEVVTVQLNGKVVIKNAALPGMSAEGPIALQHHGDKVEFTNIYIKQLD
jgi:hypothetical protein